MTYLTDSAYRPTFIRMVLSRPRLFSSVLVGALAAIMLLSDPFKGILWSQIALSLQLPLTIVPLIMLTSSKKVMGNYANKPFGAAILWIVGLVVIGLNSALLVDLAR